MQHVNTSTCVYFFRDATCHAWTVTHHIFTQACLSARLARVSLSRGQCSHANEGQRWKATDGGGAVGIAIFPIPKQTSMS